MKLATANVLLAVAVIHATWYVLATLVGGAMADRFGSRQVLLTALWLLTALPFLALPLLAIGTLPALVVAMALIGTPMRVAWGATPAYFSPRSRPASATPACRSPDSPQRSSEGLVPLVLTASIAGLGGALWPIAATTGLCAVFGLAFLATLGRPGRPAQSPEDAAVSQAEEQSSNSVDVSAGESSR